MRRDSKRSSRRSIRRKLGYHVRNRAAVPKRADAAHHPLARPAAPQLLRQHARQPAHDRANVRVERQQLRV